MTEKELVAFAKAAAERDVVRALADHMRIHGCRLGPDGRLRHFCGMKEPKQEKGESK